MVIKQYTNTNTNTIVHKFTTYCAIANLWIEKTW